MFQYRSVLAQIRRGASDRELARSHTMGRRKLAQFRALAAVQGWLDAEAPLPDEAQIAAALEPAKQAASTVSSLESHRQRIQEWLEQSVPATALLDRLLHHAIVIPIEGNFGMSANSASAFAPGGSPTSETQCLSERDIRIARVLRSLGTAPMTRQQAERARRASGTALVHGVQAAPAVPATPRHQRRGTDVQGV